MRSFRYIIEKTWMEKTTVRRDLAHLLYLSCRRCDIAFNSICLYEIINCILYYR